MDKTKHTPGPWKTINMDGKVFPRVVFPEIEDLGNSSIVVNEGRGSMEECQANARLIAAAPDLLIACEAIVHAARLNDPAAGAAAATLAMHAIEKAVGKNNEIMLGENNA